MSKSHILHVFSTPFGVDDTTWEKWYTTEHVPDMVYCGVSATGQVYRRIDNPLTQDAKDETKYFAIYQSDSPRQLHCKEYDEDVRHDSGLWGYGKSAREVGNFDARNYQFMKMFNPKDIGDEAARYLIHFEIDCSNESEMEQWYNQVVYPNLMSVPGYRRSLHYKAGFMEHGSPGDQVARFVSVHEFDSFEGVSARILDQESELGERIVGASRVFNTRAYRLLGADPAGFRPRNFVNPEYVPIPEGHSNPHKMRVSGSKD